ncbi:cytochrome C [Thiorhodococcus mannitoliphagus]|uniref:Cytochrome C n=2 Tax=Thiorhodococcus mannitoliphagus TaxID=329406 RepID=A0A6P1DRS4_9GAMM|nr:cytochrome C [Thiorhodococcus mannitoliphagus]
MMQRTPPFVLLMLALVSLSIAGLALADDDDDDDRRRGHASKEWIDDDVPLAPIRSQAYIDECGACHMAYQPELLPARAWAQIMTPAALSDHYGDDATLSEALRLEISSFLGADAVGVAATTATGAQLPRITKIAKFRDEHDEIPARLVTGNPDVGSFSKCNACHRRAAEGNYNERQIDIPGYGPWDD